MRSKVKLHPSFIIVLLYFLLTEQLYIYSLLVASFIIHELGHIILARIVGVRLRLLVIYAFGGNLYFFSGATAKQHLCIGLGGPLFTTFLLLGAFIFDWRYLFIMQCLILAINCLPILPLDGGKIIYYTIQLFTNPKLLYEYFTKVSLLLALGILLLLIFGDFPMFLLFLFVVIFLETVTQYRYRKYATAFNKVISN